MPEMPTENGRFTDARVNMAGSLETKARVNAKGCFLSPPRRQTVRPIPTSIGRGRSGTTRGNGDERTFLQAMRV